MTDKLLAIVVFTLLILLLSSCGNSTHKIIPKKAKAETTSTISGKVEVEHTINIDLSMFKEVCELEYEDVEPIEARDILVLECQAQRLKDFLDLLTDIQDSQEE